MLVLLDNNFDFLCFGDFSRIFRRYFPADFLRFSRKEMEENLYFAENRPSFLLPEYVNNVN